MDKNVEEIPITYRFVELGEEEGGEAEVAEGLNREEQVRGLLRRGEKKDDLQRKALEEGLLLAKLFAPRAPAGGVDEDEVAALKRSMYFSSSWRFWAKAKGSPMREA